MHACGPVAQPVQAHRQGKRENAYYDQGFRSPGRTPIGAVLHILRVRIGARTRFWTVADERNQQKQQTGNPAQDAHRRGVVVPKLPPHAVNVNAKRNGSQEIAERRKRPLACYVSCVASRVLRLPGFGANEQGADYSTWGGGQQRGLVLVGAKPRNEHQHDARGVPARTLYDPGRAGRQHQHSLTVEGQKHSNRAQPEAAQPGHRISLPGTY